MKKTKVLPPRKYNGEVANKVEKAIQETPDYGSFRVSSRQLPAIKNWPLGGKYKFEVIGEMDEHSKVRYGMEAGGTEGRFKIVSITHIDDSKK